METEGVIEELIMDTISKSLDFYHENDEILEFLEYIPLVDLWSTSIDALGVVVAFKEYIPQAKEKLEKMLQQLQDEIKSGNIDKFMYLKMLNGLAEGDDKKVTEPGSRLLGGGSLADQAIIKTAVDRKIPFRLFISKVCDIANKAPIIGIRKNPNKKRNKMPKIKPNKKGRKPKPKSMTAIILIAATLKKAVDELTEFDLNPFSEVRQKQLAASLLFEFCDRLLDWASPLKAEVSFDSPKSNYAPHPISTLNPVTPTRLHRKGIELNPFYPAPFMRRGSISADLIIPEYRHKPCDKTNIFAIVEIKFPGDSLKPKQLNNYHKLLQAGRDEIKRKDQSKTPAQLTEYGRLSLFRYPEDVSKRFNPDGKSKNGENDETDKKPNKPIVKKKRP